jgi:transcriptional regulator with AAA-type ATPase domain
MNRDNTNQKDTLLLTFNAFTLKKSEIDSTIGGSTSGSYSDDDGCSANWFDLAGGGYYHMDDHTTCS